MSLVDLDDPDTRAYIQRLRQHGHRQATQTMPTDPDTQAHIEELKARKRARQRIYYAEHRDEILARMRTPEYRAVNRARQRANYWRHRDQYVKREQEYSHTHREQRNAYERAWHAKQKLKKQGKQATNNPSTHTPVANHIENSHEDN